MSSKLQNLVQFSEVTFFTDRICQSEVVLEVSQLSITRKRKKKRQMFLALTLALSKKKTWLPNLNIFQCILYGVHKYTEFIHKFSLNFFFQIN